MKKLFCFALLLGLAVGNVDSLFAQRGTSSTQSGKGSAPPPRSATRPTKDAPPTATTPTLAPAPPSTRPAPPSARPTPPPTRPAPPPTRPAPPPTAPERPSARPAPPPKTTPSTTIAQSSTTRPTPPPTPERTTTRPSTTRPAPPPPTPERTTTRPSTTRPAPPPPTPERTTTRPSTTRPAPPPPTPERTTTRPSTPRPAPPPPNRPKGGEPAKKRVDIQDKLVSQKIIKDVNVFFNNNYFGHNNRPAGPRYPNYFDNQWYRQYPGSWYPPHPLPPNVWWRPAPKWDNAWGWFAAGFFTRHVIDRSLKPIPYYYGTNVYYVGDMVYVNGVPYVSAGAYYAQAAEIAARGVPQEPIVVNVNVDVPVTVEVAKGGATEVATPQEEWMPMGTFAVLKDPDATDSSVIIQLATNKAGQIAGNIVNIKTERSVPVYGAIDAETQRVALRVEGRDEIAECGLWNLTQDTLTVLLHLDKEKTEERTFVRLTNPEQETEQEEYVAP